MIAPIDPVPVETSGDVELVARLLRAGGSRAEPPREAYEGVLAAATIALERKLARHRRLRVTRGFALAASLLIAVAGVVWIGTRTPDNLQVATAERRFGFVTLLARDTLVRQPVNAGALVTQGTSLRTGAGSGVALRMTSGLSLRVAAGSELAFESPNRVRLNRGALYVDTQQRVAATSPGRGTLEVVTPLGTARDVGTQFEVRLVDAALLLRVREGLVWLTHDGGEVRGRAGEELRFIAGGVVARRAIASDDPAWDWVQTITSAPDIDDQPLSSVLAWVARETGREVRYDSPETERRAAATILHGSIRGLDPLPALETVLATSALDYRIDEDGTILITSL